VDSAPGSQVGAIRNSPDSCLHRIERVASADPSGPLLAARSWLPLAGRLWRGYRCPHHACRPEPPSPRRSTTTASYQRGSCLLSRGGARLRPTDRSSRTPWPPRQGRAWLRTSSPLLRPLDLLVSRSVIEMGQPSSSRVICSPGGVLASAAQPPFDRPQDRASALNSCECARRRPSMTELAP